MKDIPTVDEMLTDLRDIERELSPWEMDFIDDMQDLPHEYTESQINRIREIWSKWKVR